MSRILTNDKNTVNHSIDWEKELVFKRTFMNLLKTKYPHITKKYNINLYCRYSYRTNYTIFYALIINAKSKQVNFDNWEGNNYVLVERFENADEAYDYMEYYIEEIFNEPTTLIHIFSRLFSDDLNTFKIAKRITVLKNIKK